MLWYIDILKFLVQWRMAWSISISIQKMINDELTGTGTATGTSPRGSLGGNIEASVHCQKGRCDIDSSFLTVGEISVRWNGSSITTSQSHRPLLALVPDRTGVLSCPHFVWIAEDEQGADGEDARDMFCSLGRSAMHPATIQPCLSIPNEEQCWSVHSWKLELLYGVPEKVEEFHIQDSCIARLSFVHLVPTDLPSKSVPSSFNDSKVPVSVKDYEDSFVCRRQMRKELLQLFTINKLIRLSDSFLLRSTSSFNSFSKKEKLTSYTSC